MYSSRFPFCKCHPFHSNERKFSAFAFASCTSDKQPTPISGGWRDHSYIGGERWAPKDGSGPSAPSVEPTLILVCGDNMVGLWNLCVERSIQDGNCLCHDMVHQIAGNAGDIGRRRAGNQRYLVRTGQSTSVEVEAGAGFGKRDDVDFLLTVGSMPVFERGVNRGHMESLGSCSRKFSNYSF